MPIELQGISSGADINAFRIFVSSPGDLGDERLTCAHVIERLKGEFASVTRIQPIFWEQEPLTADASFQDQIPLPAETDLVIVMIWSRLGTRLHSRHRETEDREAPTGTVFEFRNALRACRASLDHRPDIIVYRKTAEPPKPSVKDGEAWKRTRDEWEKVEAFFNSDYFRDQVEGSFTGAFHTFQGVADFENQVYAHSREIVRRRLGSTGQDMPPAVWTTGSPFRGLEFFDFGDAPIFFGRIRAAAEVREALRRQAARGTAFVLVMGMSGGGKSSLVRAGVLPDLVAPGVVEGIGLWRRVVLRPSEAEGDPFRAFANALIDNRGERGVGLAELGPDAGALAEKLKIAPDAQIEAALRQVAAIHEVQERSRLEAKRKEKEVSGETDAVAELNRLLADLRPAKARLVLVIDQMEELFTDPIDTGVRDAFIDVLAKLARSGHCWVIATLRSDFFARCEEIPELVRLKEGGGTYHLLAPDPTEISQMIRQPALAAGLRFEEDTESKGRLDDTLLAAALHEPSALPLLEFTLDELYKRCAPQGPALTFAAYKELGGLEGALERRADETFAALPVADRDTAFHVVLSMLVRIPFGEEIRPVSQPAQHTMFTPGSPASRLVEAFVDARLLVSDRGLVRIAHEALLGWGRARDWIKENRNFLIVRERVRVGAARWHAEGKTADLLLPRGKQLAEAEAILREHRSEMSLSEIKFVEASASVRENFAANVAVPQNPVERSVCNTWEEAMTNPIFDAVVIGSGMCGAYCANKLFRDAKAKRTLLLEAGGFLVTGHHQNFPHIGLNVPEPMDPASDHGLPREIVWGMPWRGNTSFVGTPYCVGGKSVYWGGWCPRLTNDTLATWPWAVARYLKDNYPRLEEQFGVSERTDFIQGPLYEALLTKARAARLNVQWLTAVEPPPLAVLGRAPASGLFAFNKYSSLPILISAIRDAIDEARWDDSRRRLFLVPRAHVVKLHTSGGIVRRVEVFVDGQQRFLDVAPRCAVVLALGAIESTRIALESFPTTLNPADERMGRNLTVHMRSTTTVQIRRSALEMPGKPLKEKLQAAALLVRGQTDDGHFHLQITAADDREGDSDRLLFYMIPDIDLLEGILNAQDADFVAVTFRGCAETKGVNDQPVGNPALRWINLSPFERDEFGFRRAFVNLTINAAEARLWNAMDVATVELARKLANDDETAIQFISSSRDGLGATFHESGTLWMGDDTATSVTDTNGRFHHVANAYCVDQALLPAAGSADPALTAMTLARKISEHIASV